ncbi:hypothetical protein [Pararhodospirillum oryzae]|uniref:Uncharacterized protein n=1 Tax=Pararhodospirillum oryzae TaxID=478448 RepID=A0A512H4P2_9PROT|nr:hypothetical protein [Pararhodospirillum oryzae]GEO80439.1 hypothetical protein ROR02_05700 [Pararhodospirillum oryzae]
MPERPSSSPPASLPAAPTAPAFPNPQAPALSGAGSSPLSQPLTSSRRLGVAGDPEGRDAFGGLAPRTLGRPQRGVR